MSETDEDLEETYSDEPQYTVDLNGTRYALNKDWRATIQRRAELEYEGNEWTECFWKVASADDAENSDIHEVGDPILVIETEGPFVPWEKLDQLEVEMQGTSSYQEFDSGSGSDVDEGNGMKTIKPGEVDPNEGSDDEREVSRTHFGITPQDFQEVPSPDGEDPEKIPPKPQEFDEPTMVMWVPDNPEIEHSWSAGEAIAPMYNWIEWNVQAKANQPRPARDKADSHDHFEGLAKSHDSEVVAELQPNESPPSEEQQDDTSEDDDVPRKFKEGTAGGGHWQV